MERYANASRDSSVVSYEIGDDYIRVMFSDGSIYLYNYDSTGTENTERMKLLARSGRGLNTFISSTVKKRYARKER